MLHLRQLLDVTTSPMPLHEKEKQTSVEQETIMHLLSDVKCSLIEWHGLLTLPKIMVECC